MTAPMKRKEMRKLLWKRQGGRCFYCNGKMTLGDPLSETFATFDHRRPQSQGGKWTLKNIVLAHRICNNYRGTRRWTKGCLKKSAWKKSKVVMR